MATAPPSDRALVALGKAEAHVEAALRLVELDEKNALTPDEREHVRGDLSQVRQHVRRVRRERARIVSFVPSVVQRPQGRASRPATNGRSRGSRRVSRSSSRGGDSGDPDDGDPEPPGLTPHTGRHTAEGAP